MRKNIFVMLLFVLMISLSSCNSEKSELLKAPVTEEEKQEEIRSMKEALERAYPGKTFTVYEVDSSLVTSKYRDVMRL